MSVEFDRESPGRFDLSGGGGGGQKASPESSLSCVYHILLTGNT